MRVPRIIYIALDIIVNLLIGKTFTRVSSKIISPYVRKKTKPEFDQSKKNKYYDPLKIDDKTFLSYKEKEELTNKLIKKLELNRKFRDVGKARPYHPRVKKVVDNVKYVMHLKNRGYLKAKGIQYNETDIHENKFCEHIRNRKYPRKIPKDQIDFSKDKKYVEYDDDDKDPFKKYRNDKKRKK